MASNIELLNRVKYAGADFNTALDEILTRLQVKFAASYNDFAVSSLGVMLVDLLAFGMDNISFFIDRRASDDFLLTSRTRRSVSKLTRQLGYKMSPATAASVDLVINPTTAQAMITPLPVGFQMVSPDGSIWEAQQAYSWPIGNTDPQTITFSQTQTLQSVFTSDGTANQVFEIGNIPDGEYLVGPGSDDVSQVIVEVNGVQWTENELLTFGQTDQFEIGYNDSPPTLRFGDNIAGNIPTVGAEVRITYKTSRGPLGSVTASQPITAVRPLAVGFTSVNLTISNPTGSSGGSEPETIEKAKANAPTYFKSRGVNITKEDYNVRSGTFTDSVFGSVAVASAVTVRGASSDAALQGYIAGITAKSEEYLESVDSAATSLGAVSASTSEVLSDIEDSSTAISSGIASVDTESATVKSILVDVTSSNASVSVFLGQILSNITSIEAATGGIVSGATDALTSGTRATLNTLIANIQAAYNNAASGTSAISADIGSITTSIDSIIDSTEDVQTAQSALAASLTIAQGNVSSITTGLLTLQSTVAGINNDIDDIGLQILEHVDSFLSSDCQANLIEVPILALDADGFYAAPTIGLIKSLQVFLDAKKEVTQVVKVISGVSLLVLADMTINIGILPGYVESTVKSQVEASVLSVLKRRPFGKDLKVSELYWITDPVKNAIDGVDFIEVRVTGPVDKLDGDGGLEINDNEVVSKGLITITTEVVVPVVGE